MKNNSDNKGNSDVTIQKVTDSQITIELNGQLKEIIKKIDVLEKFLKENQKESFQIADKIYNINSINEANFGFNLERALTNKRLPEELVGNLITDENLWVESLKRALIRQNVAVSPNPMEIFSHYGWLIEVFLQKLGTAVGNKMNLRRLSFLVEVFQSSLRHLCYIQAIQIVQLDPSPDRLALREFLTMDGDDYLYFDYLDFLITSTDILDQVSKGGFVPEIVDFAEELRLPETELFRASIYLEDCRNKFLHGEIEEDEQIGRILQEYLTALVYWLRKLAFLAKYRMVSIKDIILNYRLGTKKNFVHEYGELHGVYDHHYSESSIEEEYKRFMREGIFTYNKSVLFLKGSNVEIGLQNITEPSTYPSISPFVIDQSVFTNKPTQTPEIFYYTGYDASKRQYTFALYKNELSLDNKNVFSNKYLFVKPQNNDHPMLDELFEQMQNLFKAHRK